MKRANFSFKTRILRNIHPLFSVCILIFTCITSLNAQYHNNSLSDRNNIEALHMQTSHKTIEEIQIILSNKFPNLQWNKIIPITPKPTLDYICEKGDACDVCQKGIGVAYLIKSDFASYILRFHHEEKYSFQQMKVFVDSFKDKIACKVPNFIVADDGSCIIYKKIDGDDLNYEIFDTLNDKQKSQLARDLATFIYQLQTEVPIRTAQDVLHVHNETEQKLCENQMFRVPNSELLDQDLQNFVFTDSSMKDLQIFWEHIILPKYKAAIADPRFHAVVQNDLRPANAFENIIIDKNTGKLIAVVDFSQYTIGNTLREMRHFYSLSPAFMEQVARNYCALAKINDTKEFIEHIYVFRAYRDYTNLLKSIKYPKYASENDKNSAEYLRNLKNLTRFN